MYIGVSTKPDIIHAVCLLSRLNTCYGDVLELPREYYDT
jgi:hypothetical protein